MDILIKDIDIENVDIPDINVYQPPRWTKNPSTIFTAPPVTQEIGVPVVDMPGCVEAHEQNTSRERSGVLNEDDPKGVKVYCDAGVPSFNPLDYNKDKLDFEYEAPVPKVAPPPEKPEAKAPETKAPQTPDVKCPTKVQELKEPVGHIKGDQKVVRYELVGKECIQVTEKLEVVEQIVGNIPSAGAVTATASIAVVATSSAILAKPLADMLLKVVKPAVKKAIKKIQTLLGKTPPKLSRSEIQANEYRRKRELPPLKQPKKKHK
jgi:hypothetical protein